MQSETTHFRLTSSSITTPPTLTNHSLTAEFERFVLRPISPTIVPITSCKLGHFQRASELSDFPILNRNAQNCFAGELPVRVLPGRLNRHLPVGAEAEDRA